MRNSQVRMSSAVPGSTELSQHNHGWLHPASHGSCLVFLFPNFVWSHFRRKEGATEVAGGPEAAQRAAAAARAAAQAIYGLGPGGNVPSAAVRVCTFLMQDALCMKMLVVAAATAACAAVWAMHGIDSSSNGPPTEVQTKPPVEVVQCSWCHSVRCHVIDAAHMQSFRQSIPDLLPAKQTSCGMPAECTSGY